MMMMIKANDVNDDDAGDVVIKLCHIGAPTLFYPLFQVLRQLLCMSRIDPTPPSSEIWTRLHTAFAAWQFHISHTGSGGSKYVIPVNNSC